MKNIFLLELMLFWFCLSASILYCNCALDKIGINGNWFVDDSGRVRLFRGINAVQKGYPWIPQYGHNDLTNQTYLDNLQAWGFNAVRLGVMWSGLRPDAKTVNQTYMNEMIKIINNLASRGLYVIIDMHQDMMSSRFASYDGVPTWVLDLMPNSSKPFPWPFKNQTNIGFGAYLTESCGFQFQNLYSNVNKFQEYFGEYWNIVSKQLANITSVLGYEYINEPWAGDPYKNPERLLPGVAGRTNLMPLYDNIYNQIRSNDNKTIVFYEPVTWSVMFNGEYVGTGFDRAPANDSARTALSWHYYCWLLQFSTDPLVNGTLPLFDKVFCDEFQLEISFEAVKNDMAKIGSPSFLTEFGGCSFDYGNGTLDNDECEFVLNYADKYLQSWTYWNSDFYDNSFQIQNQLIDVFSRVYPIATAGIPTSLYYNTTTKYFEYNFQLNETINASTDIFIPDRAYPKGFNVTVSSHLTWTYDQKNRLLSINKQSQSMAATAIDSTVTIKAIK